MKSIGFVLVLLVVVAIAVAEGVNLYNRNFRRKR
jgi:hypothetical protein